MITSADPAARLPAACEALRAARPEIEAGLARDGLVVLRGFPVASAEDFGRVARALSDRVGPYLAGQTDRSEVAPEVYTASRIPSLIPIPLHAEMAYSEVFPTHLMFHVQTPAAVGGHSWFADNERVAAALPAGLRDRLGREGVRYVRRLPPAGSAFLRIVEATRSGGLKSWQASLGVSTRAEAEAALAARGVPHRWRGDWLDLSTVLPAFRGARWFNQLHTAHVNRFVHGRVAVALARALERAAGFRILDATFGGGDPFTEHDLRAVLDAHRAARFTLRTEARDVLFFDNLRLSHGRAAYLGRRTVSVAFCGLP